MKTKEEKARLRAEMLERKRIEDIELDRQLAELLEKRRREGRLIRSATADSPKRGVLAPNPWQRGIRNGARFRGRCGR